MFQKTWSSPTEILNYCLLYSERLEEEPIQESSFHFEILRRVVRFSLD